ncbi:peptidase domain-containing ABC transporter [Fretibacter rubidus]|uniref:peptidase domain-containing ABC transporter n=1 Tax=Fretibacter rubidus TaxID=570162 RepID=UPI00352A32C9
MATLNFSGRKTLPVIMQTEATECGLACLTMTAKYHGHDVDLNGMRQKFSISSNGASLASISDFAAQMNFGTRALRLELGDLAKLQSPAILHWNLNHFVVLKKVKGDMVHIHDPATGVKVMLLSEVSDHFTGVALELSPVPGFEKQTAKRKMHLSELWRRLVGLKRAIIQLVVLSLVLQFIALAMPFYLQLVVDEVVVKFDKSLLLVLALGFAALTVVQQVTSLMREWTILYYGHQMSFQMVGNVFNHLINLPVQFFEKRHIGDILSRMGSTAPIQKALTQSVVAALIDGFMAIITGVVIFIYSPVLGFIVLTSVALLLLVTIAFYPILRRSQEKMIVSEAKENTHKIESIRAFIPLKLFAAQNQRMSSWRNLFADYINDSVAYGKYNLILKTLQGLITGLQTVLIVYFGAKFIISGDNAFTVGMLFAFMAYRTSFTTSIVSLFNTFIEFRLLSLHLERISDIAHTEREFQSSQPAPNLDGTALEGLEIGEAPPPRIDIKDLHFRYAKSDPLVLDSVNLTIESGDFIAITGPSGGGKTTLLKLILGLYPPTEGEILIDGHALNDSNRSAWRDKIGVVMQDDQLLSGTLADNIAFFSPDMDMQKVYRAAHKAQIHTEIMAMPMGYLSLIGDMGSALSGGQKQRVLLARALYKDPQVLLLDEGTANLDAKTEKTIVDVIAALPITRIIVAHRQEFLRRANKKIVIE